MTNPTKWRIQKLRTGRGWGIIGPYHALYGDAYMYRGDEAAEVLAFFDYGARQRGL